MPTPDLLSTTAARIRRWPSTMICQRRTPRQCGAQGDGFPRTVIDLTGRRHLPARPARVLAVGPDPILAHLLPRRRACHACRRPPIPPCWPTPARGCW